MSEDMRERIAAAIAPGAWGLKRLGLKLDDWNQGELDMSLHQADAVLAAMREPTEAMIEAGNLEEANEECVPVWQAMIDAALPAPPTPEAPD